jgi:predicted SAM-dependent methyltransferase
VTGRGGAGSPPAAPVRRLHWGCGRRAAPGWTNSDRLVGPGIDATADIREGLPFPSGHFDYAVSIHALQEIPYPDVVPALGELRRVLRPGGVLRLGLPDLERALDAYVRQEAGYFRVPDAEVTSLGGKLSLHITWYGHSRTLFTADFAAELLGRAGFVDVTRCAYRQTASGWPEIVALDNRPAETFFVEATRGPGGAP